METTTANPEGTYEDPPFPTFSKKKRLTLGFDHPE
jgi:hypothetical protein